MNERMNECLHACMWVDSQLLGMGAGGKDAGGNDIIIKDLGIVCHTQYRGTKHMPIDA